MLEDVCDNLFNPDPYYQQGGDMVRVGGLAYTCDPKADSGKRISNMMLKGKAIEADKTYKVAGWAPVAEGANGRADLGCDGSLFQEPQDHRPAQAQHAQAGGHGRQPRHGRDLKKAPATAGGPAALCYALSVPFTHQGYSMIKHAGMLVAVTCSSRVVLTSKPFWAKPNVSADDTYTELSECRFKVGVSKIDA